jgi:hypothetical protein
MAIPPLLYGSEGWILRRKDERSIQSAEMKFLHTIQSAEMKFLHTIQSAEMKFLRTIQSAEMKFLPAVKGCTQLDHIRNGQEVLKRTNLPTFLTLFNNAV